MAASGVTLHWRAHSALRARQNVEVLKALPSWREFRELLQTPVAREQDGDLNADLDDDDDDEDDEEEDDDDEAVGGKEGPGTQEKSQGSPRGAAGERDDGAQVAPMRLSFEAEDWSALAGDALRSRRSRSSHRCPCGPVTAPSSAGPMPRGAAPLDGLMA